VVSKFLLYIFYFFRSVYWRGLLNTLKLLKAEIQYEKKFAINTSGIKKKESADFFHYQGASYLVLLRIFREIFEQTKHFTFVDIGSGKGRAIFVAEYVGYNILIGVEMDQELVIKAQQNMKLYPFKREESAITFVCKNALDVVYKNEPTIYFLFNPFNELVLNQVLDKIISANSSHVWFVYMNPLFINPFVEKNMQLIKTFKTGNYTEAVVYMQSAR
jgi:SAM-dependent methyltransferase